jgi:hypothetical protein
MGRNNGFVLKGSENRVVVRKDGKQFIPSQDRD